MSTYGKPILLMGSSTINEHNYTKFFGLSDTSEENGVTFNNEGNGNWSIKFTKNINFNLLKLENLAVDLFLVGGGGAGGLTNGWTPYVNWTHYNGGGGGGGGYTATQRNVSLTNEYKYIIVIGNGGTISDLSGGATQIQRQKNNNSPVVLYQAAGGSRGTASQSGSSQTTDYSYSHGGNGGSGGGAGSYAYKCPTYQSNTNTDYQAGDGGTNGSDGGNNGLNGQASQLQYSGGNGQQGSQSIIQNYGYAFNDPSYNELYGKFGGGGGGGCGISVYNSSATIHVYNGVATAIGNYKLISNCGKGGAGGGGRGAYFTENTAAQLANVTSDKIQPAKDGTKNRGGGGGGGCYNGTPGAGGSGILIIRNARP